LHLLCTRSACRSSPTPTSWFKLSNQLVGVGELRHALRVKRSTRKTSIWVFRNPLMCSSPSSIGR